MKLDKILTRQKGAASLFVSVMLIISTTLIAMLTAKTVMVETKNTANTYRTSQAMAAASAAMDRGIAYFMANGFDADGSGVVDYGVANPVNFSCDATPTTAIANAAIPFSFDNIQTNQTTYSQFYFDNTATSGDMKRGTIVARGWSDDCEAMRTISQQVGVVSIVKPGSSPEQAWVSKASVGTNGTGTIINRYTNTNVWAGGDYGGASAAYDTYIRPSGTEVADYTDAELDSDDESLNTVKVSDRNSGIGLDVITSDAFLASKSASQLDADLDSAVNNQFFDMYFSETKLGIKGMARDAGQLIPDGGTIPADASGLVWVEGDLSLDSLGSSTSPVTLIVNGDLTINGNTDFYGIIYATGDISGTGTPVIYGSLIAEKTSGVHSMSATSTLVFKPWGDGDATADPFQVGTGAVIAGSWVDW